VLSGLGLGVLAELRCCVAELLGLRLDCLGSLDLRVVLALDGPAGRLESSTDNVASTLGDVLSTLCHGRGCVADSLASRHDAILHAILDVGGGSSNSLSASLGGIADGLPCGDDVVLGSAGHVRGALLHVTSGISDSRTSSLEVIILGGQPINEPMEHYGPFVMNTRAELVQALEDYQAGRLGVVPPDAIMPHVVR